MLHVTRSINPQVISEPDIFVDIQYEPSLGSSIPSVVSLSEHITYIAIGSLRGICVPHSGLVQRVPVTTLADGVLAPQAKFTTISP